jgi:WD repeat-containing protein 68
MLMYTCIYNVFRSLEHSTILYESDELAPLLRLSCNQQDPNYIAVIQTSSPKATIIDIRLPSIPVTELCGHQASINAIAWAPQSPNHIATCADDRQTYIWDITFSSGSSSATPISSIGGGAGSGGGSKGRVIEEPILAYAAEGEVSASSR